MKNLIEERKIFALFEMIHENIVHEYSLLYHNIMLPSIFIGNVIDDFKYLTISCKSGLRIFAYVINLNGQISHNCVYLMLENARYIHHMQEKRDPAKCSY